MLYPKSKSEKLDMELFKNPTAEYRDTPFWAWNCELDENELHWQIEQLKKMGYGGFHMHTRSGMSTKYLSEDFMKLIKSCTQKAKKENMLAWLYDEDRWPSGAAGGYVTKEPQYRQRRLLFTTKKQNDVLPKAEAVTQGKTYAIGMYDVVLNSTGEMVEYQRINTEGDAKGTVWYAYIEVFCSFMKSPGWYNGGTYVDTLNPEAIKKFTQITHDKYKEAVGDEFGKTVPAIFTDEPQFNHKNNLPFGLSTDDVGIPWTPDFDKTFAKHYGYDIVDKIPEIFWEFENGAVSQARYHFHDHTSEMFAAAFSDVCGNWCEDNGISLTGHLFGEYTLLGQIRSSGEAMRQYRSFQLPGIDMLFDSSEYSTAKQAQSSARQYGREGVMSELYGVTNWDFDFRGHKHQGDWQAALGITVRVPHLSWVSMKGAAKRDYPASLNYQSPWYEEYPFISDHFARLNTVLTRGKPQVNVAVIHPIESYWLHYGPEESTAAIRKQLDDDFDSLVSWLLLGTIDFDFVCESSIPELHKDISNKFAIGEMEYSTVLVPGCETLRQTTVDALNRFIEKGGRVIFAGDAPKYTDATSNGAAKELYEKCEKIAYNRYAILNALNSERDIEIKNDMGAETHEFIYQLREDGKDKYLFIANAVPYLHPFCNETQAPTRASIKIKGEYEPIILNTMTGEEEPVSFTTGNGYTIVKYNFYEHDSLLLRLSEKTDNTAFVVGTVKKTEIATVDFKSAVEFKRHEENVCVLDIAEYSLGGAPFESADEVLRIDVNLRKIFNWPLASGQDMQPWAIEKEEITNFVTLRYTVECEDALNDICFCAEELSKLTVNGKEMGIEPKGYFVDKAIKKFPIGSLCQGKNVIEATIPFGTSESLEACYLTGEFDVFVKGCDILLKKASTTLGFGDISSQGMPFYGGNITYRTIIDVPEDCNLDINIASYKGALTKVALDGSDVGKIVYAPYSLVVRDVKKGKHVLEYTLFGNRHNTFGALHNCGTSIYYGQHHWYSTANSWSYEYCTKPTGILKSPVITMHK
ncbi:MAG: hypothetical protein E7395_03340 [Ruminococcaceae bacterium]|nr:hypothetical protein [Oscillospiraceae bacterium]